MILTEAKQILLRSQRRSNACVIAAHLEWLGADASFIVSRSAARSTIHEGVFAGGFAELDLIKRRSSGTDGRNVSDDIKPIVAAKIFTGRGRDVTNGALDRFVSAPRLAAMRQI